MLFVELTVTAVISYLVGLIAGRRARWFEAWEQGRRFERYGRRFERYGRRRADEERAEQ